MAPIRRQRRADEPEDMAGVQTSVESAMGASGSKTWH